MKEDNYVVKAGIDISESIIITHKLDIDYLKEENYYLKCNLQVNVEKLNDALKSVDM
ncbi:409_t:CDS:1, partial [Funneliformis geosporum]